MKTFIKLLLLYILIPPIPIGVAGNVGEISYDRNYTLVRSMLTENGNSYIDNIQYYDGIGRVVQTIQKGITPSGNDLATYLEYDESGYPVKNWLSTILTNNNGAFSENIPEVSTSQYGDSRPFFQTEYEPSPLKRISSQYGPGDLWQGKPIHTELFTNQESGVLSCAYFHLNETGKLQKTANYPSNELYIVKNTDEDGNINYIFKDKQDQVILSRQINEGEYFDTYYVYDDFGNTRYILPPGIENDISQESLDKYAYQYRYNERNLCVEKRLPGIQPIYFVYDYADRLILSQNGNQRASGQWLFNKYDSFGREIITGVLTSARTLADFTALYKNSIITEKYTNSLTEQFFGYSNQYKFSDKMDALIINYYDNYQFINLDCYSSAPNLSYNADSRFGERYENSTGLPTGTYFRQLDNLSKGDLNVHYYDLKGNEIQTQNAYIPIGYQNTIYIKYNFTGLPSLVKKEHTDRLKKTVTEIYEYEYDHAGRHTKLYHTYNNDEKILLSESIYDELGRLREKRRHNGRDSIKYDYNIRNWMTKIHNTDFSEILLYNENLPSKAKACYNGNISTINYMQNGYDYNYIFSYDELNRLTNAETCDKMGNDKGYNELYEYDRMGNITYLERKNYNSYINRLSISHNGNQIVKVTDSSNRNERFFSRSSFNFGNRIDSLKHIDDALNEKISKDSIQAIDLDSLKEQTQYPGQIILLEEYSGMIYLDKADHEIEFFYDSNGNTIQNDDKEIRLIRYNLLNLPDSIAFRNHNNIVNSYLADGRKICSTYNTHTINIGVSIDQEWTAQDPIETTVYEWDNGYMYKNGNLKMISNDEGYIQPDNSPDGPLNSYHYYIPDHLGNVRITKTPGESKTKQSLEYYPSGTLFQRIENQSRQPYMFGMKELVSAHGLDQYDFGARMQEPVISTFTTMDPLCEKYPWLSPYAYCGNNPIRFADPSGMKFTEAAWEEVKRLIQEIARQGYRNNKKKERTQARLDNGSISNEKRSKLEKKLGKLNEKITNLNAVKEEINTLASSDQIYDIKKDNSLNVIDQTTGITEKRANAGFNFYNGYFEISLPSNSGLDLLSHELKHAYQFETGTYSIDPQEYPIFYDQSDETEAYKRGALFGGTHYQTFPQGMYTDIPAGPLDSKNHPNIPYMDHKALQRFANMGKGNKAFRVNGITYYKPKNQ